MKAIATNFYVIEIIYKINSSSVSRFDGREFFYMSLNFKDFIGQIYETS